MSISKPRSVARRCNGSGACVPRLPSIGCACTTRYSSRCRPGQKARACTSSCCCACRSEEHTSELQSLMRISYAVFCLKKKKTYHNIKTPNTDRYQHITSTSYKMINKRSNKERQL